MSKLPLIGRVSKVGLRALRTRVRTCARHAEFREGPSNNECGYRVLHSHSVAIRLGLKLTDNSIRR